MLTFLSLNFTAEADILSVEQDQFEGAQKTGIDLRGIAGPDSLGVEICGNDGG